MISLPGEGLSALVDEDAGEGFGLGGQVASLAKRLGIIAGVGWSDGKLWLEEVAGLRRLGRVLVRSRCEAPRIVCGGRGDANLKIRHYRRVRI